MVCTRCHGDGTDGWKPCPVCKGYGRGMMYGVRFLYWGRRIDDFTLRLGVLRRIVNILVNVSATGMLVYGLFRTGLRVQETQPTDVFTVLFWTDPNSALLFLWFGFLAGFFLVYRMIVAVGTRQFVKRREYGESTEIGVATDMEWGEVKKIARQDRIDASRAYSQESLKAVTAAFGLAKRIGSKEVTTIHLYTAMLDAPRIRIVFSRLGLPFSEYKDKLVRAAQALPKDAHSTSFSTEAYRALLDAYIEAHTQKQALVDVTDLFIATVRADEKLQEILYDHDVTIEKLENVVHWIRLQHQMQMQHKKFASAAKLKPKSTMNRAMTALATPFLDRMADDLTRAAANFHLAPVVGRDKELESIFRAIEGGGKSVILVGKRGVGKSAMVEAIAQRMVEEDVPEILQDKRLVSLDVSRLVAGASASEAQERLLAVLYEVGRARNIVLVVPHVAGMVGITSGSGESIDLSQVFATELSRGYFFAITTATPEEYTNALERSTLGGVLTKIDIPEPEANEAIRMLQSGAGIIEYQNKVFFSYDAIDAAVRMTERYAHETHLPEKAIEVAKEAANAARNTKGENSIVTKEDVAKVVSEKTNIPLEQLTKEQSKRLLELEDIMHGRVIGQDEAVRAVASAMRRAGAAVRSDERPIANFLFLGPTGVGKTELAKTLAEAYFGSEDTMIRLDMSEYQDAASLYKLIGEPGSDQAGGILSEAVRKNPFSLVLLDEIEKADANILTVFLQVMDDARLTDNTGRTIDFTNVILIMTSNAGAQFIQDEIRNGTSVEIITERLVTEQLKNSFRPEFLNRFDDVIVFTPITESELIEITKLMLKKVSARLAEKGLILEVTEGAVAELAHAGYDPAFGARPLRRVIQDRVDNAMADLILKGEVGRRDRIIYDVGGEVRIEKAEGL